MRQKSQRVEFNIPLRYQKPTDTDVQALLHSLQEKTYEPLMRGCDEALSENNFPALRAKISLQRNTAAERAEDGEPLYVITEIAWSEQYSAKLVNAMGVEVSAEGAIDLAQIASGITGSPKAGAKYKDDSTTSLSVQGGRYHWGYLARPLKVVEGGRLDVDWNSRALILSPIARKESL